MPFAWAIGRTPQNLRWRFSSWTVSAIRLIAGVSRYDGAAQKATHWFDSLRRTGQHFGRM